MNLPCIARSETSGNELQQMPVEPISEEDARELDNELAADLRETNVRIERRIEKFIARQDKDDGQGVPAQLVKDRFGLTDEDIRKFCCWLRVYSARTDQILDKSKTPSLQNVAFFDGGQADIEHGLDTGCECPTCLNMAFGLEPPDCWPFKRDCWPIRPKKPVDT